MIEGKVQADIRDALEEEFPGCIILKNDANYIQGIPDLTVLYKNKWAVLEVKRSEKEAHQPNQDYYVETLDDMSFSRFIFPENKDQVISELKEFFG